MGLADLAVYKASGRSCKASQGQQRLLTSNPRESTSIYHVGSRFLQNFIMAVIFILALLSVACPSMAFDMGQSTRCVTIPNQMKVCKDVGYSEMRLPNFLGHSNLEGEVVPRSEDWRPLLQTGCHPQAQAFLCSLIAPVCLDT